MKLSIITVNLDNCEGLRRTIDSVIAQSFNDFEWIVIDGGSTDGSKELIERNADFFSYWVSEPDKGIYNAMNKGIKAAKGDYLQFLNSGDWLHDSEVLQDVFSTDWKTDIIYCDYEFYVDGQLFSTEKTPSDLQLSYLVNHWIGHSASFIKRHLFDENPYDESYHIVSDWKFFIQQALQGHTFQHLSRIVSCVDDSGISITNQALVQQERNNIVASILPQCIKNDIKEYNRITDDRKLMELKRYKDDRWCYRKLILAVLRIIRFCDSFRKRK